jgi:hypothetical protein
VPRHLVIIRSAPNVRPPEWPRHTGSRPARGCYTWPQQLPPPLRAALSQWRRPQPAEKHVARFDGDRERAAGDHRALPDLAEIWHASKLSDVVLPRSRTTAAASATEVNPASDLQALGA